MAEHEEEHGPGCAGCQILGLIDERDRARGTAVRPEQELAESVTRREPGRGYVIDKHGQEYIAHVEGCDCLADDSLHGAADHPVAALRRLLALRAEVHGA